MITPESYEAMRIAHDRVMAAQEGGQERLAAEEALRRMLWDNRATIIDVVEPQPNRYWEGRWRDEAAENDRLQRVVRADEHLAKQLQLSIARNGRLVAALDKISTYCEDKMEGRGKSELWYAIEEINGIALRARRDADQADAGRGGGSDPVPDLRDPEDTGS